MIGIDEDEVLINREEDEDEEDETPDWRSLSKLSSKFQRDDQFDDPSSSIQQRQPQAFIPKRGEKDFEPIEGQSIDQNRALDESRRSLFTALSIGFRGHSSKDHVRCIWSKKENCGETSKELRQREINGVVNGKRSSSSSTIGLGYVDGVPRGVMFSSIGIWNRIKQRLELMPEELLYLIERGKVQCWSEEDRSLDRGSMPMSVQWAWDEMIGSDGLTLERYQVYAYLKRLGYTVLRRENVTRLWNYNFSSSRSKTSRPKDYSGLLNIRNFLFLSFFSKALRAVFFDRISKIFQNIKNLFLRISRTDSGQAAGVRKIRDLDDSKSLSWPGIWFDYESAFRNLRIIPSGVKVKLPGAIKVLKCNNENYEEKINEENDNDDDRSDGFEVFYYVYKPNNRFPKTKPPLPDFEVCVVDVEKMDSLPTVKVLEGLFDSCILRSSSSRKTLNHNLFTTNDRSDLLKGPPDSWENKIESNNKAQKLSNNGKDQRAINSSRREETGNKKDEVIKYNCFLNSFFLSFNFLNIGNSELGKRFPINKTRRPGKLPGMIRKNVFSSIKNGERDVLISIVDHGLISFMKFTETDFGVNPLVGTKSLI
ncbi:hypothetical protein BY996DRAFT_6420575 [Phakopsora pachyrhizi]|nr:hypothetical protein BY996DRAFT_6420575 [Phakopsora pachyrhizi]